MRYLFGFLCVCALGVGPLVGCGETTRDMCEGVSCNDDNECTDDVCNPVTGACEYTPVEDGTACVDGTCLGGICMADETIMGGPSDQVLCSASSPCTVWLLGDSNTAAMGDNFVSIDGNHPEYDTVNLGRGGASSADGLADVESLLATRKAPEIAVVTYAGGDLLESYPAAPPGATSPTRAEVDQIYGNLEAICELLQSEGTYCVLGKSIGALTELHPLDEGLPPGTIDFAALTYFDNGYVLVGEAIEERYQPGWVSFRVPKDFDLWGHGDLFGYIHLTQAGYSIMSDRLEAKLDDLTRDPGLCEGVVCDDGNECTNDVCDPPTGMCDDLPVADGTACGGDAGTCQQGSCRVACTEQGIRDAIVAGGGPYTFDCAGPTTVETEAEIEIDNDVILDGADNLSIDGQNTHRVFSVAAGVTAELRGLTINRGAAPYDSTRYDYGGGIYNEGVPTLTDSAVSENTARYAGGIYNEGVLTLSNSTVSGNTSGYAGGGILNGNTVTLVNSTVSGNTAEVGSGIAGSEGSVMLKNTLVDGDCDLRPMISNGHNIESPGDTCGFDQSNDRVNVSADDLKLGPLQDNGGPTMTHALEAGSVAIDQIRAEDCVDAEGQPLTTDQRGEPRPETGGTMCDVGAFEVQP